MMALAGQVGRIGCLVIMVLLVCATGIETASGHRHHVGSGDNDNQHQGVASKSRILTKTESSINQQDQSPTMTIKSLANSGPYILTFFLIKERRSDPLIYNFDIFCVQRMHS